PPTKLLSATESKAISSIDESDCRTPSVLSPLLRQNNISDDFQISCKTNQTLPDYSLPKLKSPQLSKPRKDNLKPLLNVEDSGNKIQTPQISKEKLSKSSEDNLKPFSNVENSCNEIQTPQISKESSWTSYESEDTTPNLATDVKSPTENAMKII